MGFFRIGIGRRVSLGIGPVTFYGGGRKRRSPGCRRCGKRTPYNVCANCQKELKKIVQEAVPVFQRALQQFINVRDEEEKTKAKKVCKKVLQTLQKCSALGITWNGLKTANSNYRFTDSLATIYVDYVHSTRNPLMDNARQRARLEKLHSKYVRKAQKLQGVNAPDLLRMITDESAGLQTKHSKLSDNSRPINKLLEMAQESIKIAHNTTLDVSTRYKAYNTALDIVDEMLKMNTDSEVHQSLKDLENTLRTDEKELGDTPNEG